ncbi:hypothetical protein SASPL_104226 [Salvia splendens]|uniref:C2 domain-containing protein n=1 Tax=Salvia splendens TaxID=180675 RepID=A0A8X8YGT5_SALSN|nr:hypothetical protein SASPL_104226 [Salvia splendens]
MRKKGGVLVVRLYYKRTVGYSPIGEVKIEVSELFDKWRDSRVNAKACPQINNKKAQRKTEDLPPIMGSWRFEITVVSAENLPDIRRLGRMKVYAVVSLNREYETMRETTVDKYGVTGPPSARLKERELPPNEECDADTRVPAETEQPEAIRRERSTRRETRRPSHYGDFVSH